MRGGVTSPALLQTMYTNQAKGYAQGLLSNTWHFDLRVVTLIMQQLSWLISGDVILLSPPRGLKACYAKK